MTRQRAGRAVAHADPEPTAAHRLDPREIGREIGRARVRDSRRHDEADAARAADKPAPGNHATSWLLATAILRGQRR
jgi:hypothetical protein